MWPGVVVLLVSAVLLVLDRGPLPAASDDCILLPRSPPGLNSPSKLWWTKELTPDYFVAGRLSERQVKYVLEGGFKGIVSLFTYEDDDPGDMGGEYLPTTREARELATQLGLQYEVILDPGEDWATVEAVKKLAAVLPSMRKPVLLHCNRAYTITFVTLLHLANLTALDPHHEPKVNSAKFFDMTAAMGLDFTMEHTKRVVAEITGEPFVLEPPRHTYTPSMWRDYWFAQPVYKNWFWAGQIMDNHVSTIEKTGFKTLVNLRMGLVYKGKRCPEGVNLLNVNDRREEHGDCHSLESLLRNRIDSSRPNHYISDFSDVNYETVNPGEFGDDKSYNELLERKRVDKSTVRYLHIPVNVAGSLEKNEFEHVKEKLMSAGERGPVIVHDSDGKRAAHIAVLAAAIQHGKDLNWALARSGHLGFHITTETVPDAYNLYRNVLGKIQRSEL